MEHRSSVTDLLIDSDHPLSGAHFGLANEPVWHSSWNAAATGSPRKRLGVEAGTIVAAGALTAVIAAASAASDADLLTG